MAMKKSSKSRHCPLQRDRQDLRHRQPRGRLRGHRRPAPGETQLVALSLLVLGDEHCPRRLWPDSPAITIDGCKLACASKMVKESGGNVAQEIDVLDVYRRHKEFKPQGIAELNEGGQKLARALAEEVLPRWIDRLAAESKGGQNA